jgi:hypothetical protein
MKMEKMAYYVYYTNYTVKYGERKSLEESVVGWKMIRNDKE